MNENLKKRNELLAQTVIKGKEEIPLFLEEKLSLRTKMRTTSGNFDFGLDSAAEIW